MIKNDKNEKNEQNKKNEKNIKNVKKEKEKKEEKEKIPLTGNEKCYQFLEKYFKLPNQLELKKKTNNLNENLLKMDEDIEYFLFAETSKTVKAKSKMTQKDNPIEIILQYLLDKKFRTYIFSSKSQSLAIKALKILLISRRRRKKELTILYLILLILKIIKYEN